MTISPRRRRGLALLAGLVLALHLWLMERVERVPGPEPLREAASAMLHVSARTLPPDPVSTAPAAVPSPLSPAHRIAEAVPVERALIANSEAQEPPVVPVTMPVILASAPASSTALVAAPTPAKALAVAVPPPMRLHYKITVGTHGLELSGKGELLWRHDGRQYEARLDLGGMPGAMRTQRTTGQITAQGLAPTRFSDRRRNEEAVHFDRAAGRLVFSNNRDPIELQPGAQDRLSVLLQLAALAAGGNRGELAMQVAGTHDADVWQFTFEGEENLRLPGGNLRALKLQRLPRKEFDQKVELWLAPGQDYAPVRLRLTQPNGEWLEQQWSGTDRS